MEDEDLELEFIAGSLFENPVPKEKAWLFKYFRSEREQQFVKYFLIFNNYHQFVDRTGHVFSYDTLYILNRKIKNLLAAHTQAKGQMNLELLARIETGKYNWRQNK